MYTIRGLLYDLALIQTCLAQNLADEAGREIDRVVQAMQDTTVLPGDLRLYVARLLLHAQHAVSLREDERWRVAAARAVWQAYVYIHGQQRHDIAGL